MRDDACTGVHSDLHAVDLTINLLHKLDNKVHKLVLPKVFKVLVGNEETKIIALDWLSAQNDKLLSTLHQEAREPVGQNLLDFISLLDTNTQANRVNGGLNEALFIFVTRNGDGLQQELARSSVYLHTMDEQ